MRKTAETRPFLLLFWPAGPGSEANEAHKCIINLRLKNYHLCLSITFVQLSGNFMAYLDVMVVVTIGFEEFIFCKRKIKSGQIKRLACQRTQKIYGIIHSSHIYPIQFNPTKLLPHKNWSLTPLSSIQIQIFLVSAREGVCIKHSFIKKIPSRIWKQHHLHLTTSVYL